MKARKMKAPAGNCASCHSFKATHTVEGHKLCPGCAHAMTAHGAGLHDAYAVIKPGCRTCKAFASGK